MATTKPSKTLFGRRVLYTSELVITADNVLAVLNKVLPDFNLNKAEIEYLYNYYRGEQTILSRTKKVRPEINNKIVENHALEIVSFKTGYVFGEPVQYVRRAAKQNNIIQPEVADKNANEISEKISLLNEFMFSEDKATNDKDLAEWFFICGTAYRMVLPYADANDNPFEIDTLDPRYTAVVYSKSFGKKPVMSIQEVVTDTDTIKYCIYTPNEYFEIVETVVTPKVHALGYIPIIEYPANTARLGSFEIVLGLLDAINSAGSNRMDGIEQFVQAFVKFVNCKMDKEKFEEMKELGAIMVKSDPGNPADVGVITNELNQTEVQVTTDHLYQMVLIICGMPDRNGTNRTTGDTGQAVILRDGWSAAESRARDTELMFKRSEKQFLRLVLRIVKDTDGLEVKLSDIDIKFTRNKTDNLLTKTQGLQNMLEAGVHPQIAITNSGLFSDPEQVYLDSLPYLEKWIKKQAEITPSNNKPNPVE